MPLQVVLSNRSGVPIYEQIQQQITRAIVTGELKEGDALPSIRALARDLQISVITTTRAYTELASQGLITNVPGKGSFVLPCDTALLHEQALREIEDHFAQAVTRSKLSGIDSATLQQLLDLAITQHDSQEEQP